MPIGAQAESWRDRCARCQRRSPGLLARQSHQGRPPDGDTAADQSGGRAGWPAELDLRHGGAQANSSRGNEPTRSRRSPLRARRRPGRRRLGRATTTVPASRAGGAEAIDLAINQAGADQPVKLDGGLTMEGKRATLAGTRGPAAGRGCRRAQPDRGRSRRPRRLGRFRRNGEYGRARGQRRASRSTWRSRASWPPGSASSCRCPMARCDRSPSTAELDLTGQARGAGGPAAPRGRM